MADMSLIMEPSERDISKCRRCVYFVPLHDGYNNKDTNKVRFCGYILKTGKRRGCSPAVCDKAKMRPKRKGGGK